MAQPTTEQLDTRIARAREQYLHCTWAGLHDAADLYSGEVDHLLDERQKLVIAQAAPALAAEWVVTSIDERFVYLTITRPDGSTIRYRVRREVAIG